MKRIFDFTVSLFVIAILTPILFPIMIILKMTGEHYIFYTQPRMGLNGKKFNLLKFATMLKNSPNIGTGDITIQNDPRVLPIGRFLRITKINELPQIFNIVMGDMSFVGPRPLTPKTFAYYSKENQEIIKKMKPGLTGIGSIIFRDEESILGKSKLSWEDCFSKQIMPYKSELEKWYYKKRNFKLDLLLIFITAWVVIKPSTNIMEKLFKDLPERQF